MTRREVGHQTRRRPFKLNKKTIVSSEPMAQETGVIKGGKDKRLEPLLEWSYWKNLPYGESNPELRGENAVC